MTGGEKMADIKVDIRRPRTAGIKELQTARSLQTCYQSDIRLLETRTKTLSGGLRDAARSYETTENTNVSILST